MNAFSFRENLGSLWRENVGQLRPLDGFRALACFWVLGLHVLSLMGSFWTVEEKDVQILPAGDLRALLGHPALRLLVKGELGVDVFFVLSGFLIARILFRELDGTGRIALGAFYRDRLLRLLPAYALCMVLYAVLLDENTGAIWANLFYVNNFLTTYRQFMLHSWSLAVEWQFYLLFPLLLMGLRRLGWLKVRVLAVLWLGNIAINLAIAWKFSLHQDLAMNPALGREACARYNDLLYDNLYNRFGCLLTGAIAFLIHSRGGPARFFRPWGGGAWALGLASAGILFAILSPSPVAPADPSASGVVLGFISAYKNIFSAAVAFFMLAMLADWAPLRPLTRFFSLKLWQPLAALSYGVYLIHPLVIKLFYLAFPPVRPEWTTVLGLAAGAAAASLLLALPLYAWVERPFMRMRPKPHAIKRTRREPVREMAESK